MEKQHILLIFSIIFTLFLSGCSAGYTMDGDVLVLTNETYEQAHKEFDHLFIKFFAPWCQHCKDMAEDWKDAAEILSKKGVQLAEIDCATIAENKPFCDPHSKGYPTLKLFKHKLKDPIQFEGQRKKDNIVSFALDNFDKVMKIKGPSGNEYDQLNFFLELTDQNFKQAVTEFQNVFVHFYKSCPRCTLYEQKWKRVAKDLQERPDKSVIAARINCDENLVSCASVTSFPALRLFSATDSTYLEFKGNKEVKNLVNFAIDNMATAKQADL